MLSQGRSSSPVGYGIGIAEVVGSNPTRSTIMLVLKIQFLATKSKNQNIETPYSHQVHLHLFLFMINKN